MLFRSLDIGILDQSNASIWSVLDNLYLYKVGYWFYIFYLKLVYQTLLDLIDFSNIRSSDQHVVYVSNNDYLCIVDIDTVV